MITAILIIAHSRRTNNAFNPDVLYVGTLIADIAIFQAIFGV